jgi:DNA segregation ATPase FtsK/SpoIIIE, S-DNA-T family
MRITFHLGLSFEDFENKKNHLQDGLNNKRSILDITTEDLKQLELSGNVFRDIKALLNKKKHHRKEIELSFDGLLKIRVITNPLQICSSMTMIWPISVEDGKCRLERAGTAL